MPVEIQQGVNIRCVIVGAVGARGAELAVGDVGAVLGAADVLPLAVYQLLPLVFDDDAVQLLAQASGLGFGGDVAGGGGGAAAGVGAEGFAAGDGAFALVLGTVYDLEFADAGCDVGAQADALALAVQPPVGGQGNQVPAIRAMDGPAPQIRLGVFVEPDRPRAQIFI